MASHVFGNNSPRIIQWIVDTRPLWPVAKQAKSTDEVQELRTVACRELALLPEVEQASVLKYYHLKDAKMSLVSHLLKRLVIVKYCNVPWSKVKISRATNGKPCYTSPSIAKSQASIDFNVSHQAGIVSLIAAVGFEGKVDTGTDIVCVNERKSQDLENIDKSGFFEFVDIYAEVFSQPEVTFMKLGPISLQELRIQGDSMGYGKDALSRCQRRGGETTLKVKSGDEEKDVEVSNSKVIDVKLRRFYAMWCLRETYVKMTGDALMAPWLKELEILDAQTPAGKVGILNSNSLEPGDIQGSFTTIFKGKVVRNVKMELSALGSDYMVGGAVRCANVVEQEHVVMGEWRQLELEQDVLAVAEANP